MLKILWIVSVAVVASCYGNQSSKHYLNLLPWEARHVLLQLQPHLNVRQLTAPPVPLYRPDLGDEIAYWMISYNDKEYAILSAGDHTDDNQIILQGSDPSPVTTLREKAKAQNGSCLRYTVLTPSPDVNMACDTAEGRIKLRQMSHQNVTSLWEEMKLNKRKHDGDDVLQSLTDVTPAHFYVISAEQPLAFPVTGMRSCHIRPVGYGNGSDLSVKALCGILGVCGDDGRVHTHRKTEYGEEYVHLEPVHVNQVDRPEHDLHFEVVGVHRDNSVVSKGFAIEPTHRSKRQTSAYTYYSIDDETQMPDYNQFEYGKCQVGCGPVAWAQIFGYYDRRGHASTGSTASQSLYKCGSDGTTGDNSCVAPASNDVRMKAYIGKLNDVLGTFCLTGQGATTQNHMDDVEGFFKARQGASGDVILKARALFLTQLIGIYSDDIRDDALAFLRQKWPVIVGFRVDGIFSQHYAVMTKYRTRTVTTKKCFLGICRTTTDHEYDMYLHMGWGGSQNGWRKAEMFMAVVAKY